MFFLKVDERMSARSKECVKFSYMCTDSFRTHVDIF